MKQKTILRAVLAAVLSLVATAASAHDFEVDGIYYKYNGDGTVSVTFQGNSYYDYDNEYTKDVTIPSSVIHSGTTYSVTSIDGYAFRGCSGLTSVSIPNSVTSIGNSAFSSCSGLTSVSIPNSVNSIGDFAFGACSGLESIVVESGNSKYDSRDNCNAIIETATNTLLAGCKNTTIPNYVNSIGYSAFYGCSGLTSVTIPNSVTSIGGHAFGNCSGLTSVTIPNSVTSIGKSAFSSCSGLTSVTIPNSVSSIGTSAFYNCSGLTRVDISSMEAWLGIKFADYYSNPLSYAKHLYLNGEEVKDLVIPNSFSSIGNCAFSGCSGLTSVTIPNSVNSIGVGAFSYCSGLTSVTIPNSVTSIDDMTFSSCSGLKSVTIPNSITSIGEAAFSGCSGLTSVTIPNSVTSIGKRAFRDCSGLKTIFYNAENCADFTDDFTNNSRVFNYGPNIIIGKDVKKVPDYLFYYLENAPTSVISKSVTPPTCGASSFNFNAYKAKLYVPSVPSGAINDYKAANVWKKFTTIEGIGTNDAVNVADLIEGTNRVNFGLQGVKMHDGVLYACTTAKSVNESYPTLHGNNAVDMDTYEDRNFAEFDQRDWVAIRGLVDGFVGKELSYPFVATFAEGVLTPSETITATADAAAYTLNTFRAENILHGGYSNYAEGVYKAYYVPARVNEVAYFMGLIETVNDIKYLYSNNANGRKDGEGIKIEGSIADNLTTYSLLEGILVADASTKAGVKIIMLKDLGAATGVEGIDTADARIYTADGNIIIAAVEDGEAAVYDFTGRLIKSVPVASGNSTAVPVTPGYYIVKTETKTQSVVVK